METQYAGAEGMLPHIKVKLTIRNCLSYNLVNSFTLPSISKYRSRYEADVIVSVVSFFSNSLG